MNQTTNYQLSQWDATDRIWRTDFNNDNEKIDTALKAQADALEAAEADLRSRDLRVKLLQTMAGTDLRLVTLGVEDIDFTPYLYAELVVETTEGGSELFVQPDGMGTFRACQLGGEVYDSSAAAYGVPDGSGRCGLRARMWSYPGAGRTHFLSARMGAEEFTLLHAIHLRDLNEIQQLNIWATEEGGIPSGSKIYIYGVKR